MNAKQAFALGLAAASETFRDELTANVPLEAFDVGPQRDLFAAMVAKDAKAIIASLKAMGIALQSGEKVKAFLVRSLAEDGQRELETGEKNREQLRIALAAYGTADSYRLEKVESILCRARLAKTFGGPDAAVAILKIGLKEFDASKGVEL